MLARVKEAVLPWLIAKLYWPRETMTKKEEDVQKQYLDQLKFKTRTTGKPIIVAMVGLVGSGKSAVAKQVAEHLRATVISGDKIRVMLRAQGEQFEKARKIAENATIEIIKKHGGNIVLDSDFIDDAKRASIRAVAKELGTKLVFIRTYCDHDIAMGRIIAGESDDFFSNASSQWTGEDKGQVVKLREFHRRTLLHYKWSKTGGGKWTLRHLPFKIGTTIDTGKEGWSEALKNDLDLEEIF